jgi:hypothetical protein
MTKAQEERQGNYERFASCLTWPITSSQMQDVARTCHIAGSIPSALKYVGKYDGHNFQGNLLFYLEKRNESTAAQIMMESLAKYNHYLAVKRANALAKKQRQPKELFAESVTIVAPAEKPDKVQFFFDLCSEFGLTPSKEVYAAFERYRSY